MAIWHRHLRHRPVQAGKAHIDGHGPHLLVHDIAPVCHFDSRRQSEAACAIARAARVSVGATLEPGAGSAKGHGEAGVVEAVEVGVAGCLDGLSAVAFLEGDGVPVLERVPSVYESADGKRGVPSHVPMKVGRDVE
jgi:hypothetical protein